MTCLKIHFGILFMHFFYAIERTCAALLYMLKYVLVVQKVHLEAMTYYCVVLLVGLAMMMDLLLVGRVAIKKASPRKQK